MTEITNTTEKEEICDKLTKLLNEKKYRFTTKASRLINLDSSWTEKAVIEGMKLHAILKNPIYWEMSKKEGNEEDVIFLMKPCICDFSRWIDFKFAQDENGEDCLVVIISAHKDREIYC